MFGHVHLLRRRLIVDVVKLILVSGGVTPLMWAAKAGKKKTARLLIEANAETLTCGQLTSIAPCFHCPNLN